MKSIKSFVILLGALISYTPAFSQRHFNSVSELMSAAERGDVVAQNTLAIELVTGQNMPQNVKQAVYWFEKAASQGHQDAQVNAGRAYAEGYLGEPDYTKALAWFRKAIDQGKGRYPNTYATALTYMGFTYERMEDDKNAVYWLEKAVNENDISAMQALGRHYLEGTGVAKDEAKGFSLIQTSANSGDPSAQNMMGVCYQHGIGVERNGNQAFRWYKKSADNGVPTAIMNLGVCYASGFGVNTDYAMALSLFREAADYGELGAYLELGIAYMNGEGVERDYDQATSFFDIAAQNGHNKAYLLNGAMNYEKEYGLQDYKKASEMFLKYVKNYRYINHYDYDDRSLGYAYRRLSSIYRYGRGVAADEARANEYLEKSKNLGDQISEETLKAYMRIK